MDNEPKKMKIHPLTAAAAIAVILVSMTGIAAMTGLLPNFSKTPAADATASAPAITAEASASQPIETTAPASAAEPTPTPTPAAAEAPVKKPAPKKPTVVANNQATAPAQPEQAVEAPAPTPVTPPPPPPCPNCGVVESARSVQQQGQASGMGAAAGALLGGVLGHQVGGGNGKTLATIAGAVGGGLAGNSVEKSAKTTTQWEVIVRMEDGSRQRFLMNEQRWRAGDQVQVNNGQLSQRNQ